MSVSLAENPVSEGISVRDFQGQWSVAHVRRREEKSIAKALAEIEGVWPYLPIITVTRRYLCLDNGRRVIRRKDVQLPLFEEYIFVAWQSERLWSEILGTKGVNRLLPVTRQAQLIRELDSIQRCLAHSSRLETEEWIVPGTPAVIVAGGLAGVEGEIHHRRGHRVFIVSVGMLGKGAIIEVEDWQIERI